MKNKKKLGAFDKFYRGFMIVVVTLLIGCILWYIFVESKIA